MTDNHEPTNGGFPLRRPRRLRTTPIMRDMVAETHVAPADLIYPLFIADGITGLSRNLINARSVSAYDTHPEKYCGTVD